MFCLSGDVLHSQLSSRHFHKVTIKLAKYAAARRTSVQFSLQTAHSARSTLSVFSCSRMQVSSLQEIHATRTYSYQQSICNNVRL